MVTVSKIFNLETEFLMATALHKIILLVILHYFIHIFQKLISLVSFYLTFGFSLKSDKILKFEDSNGFYGNWWQ